LRLLTPNWQSRLPGYGYDGDDSDGYRTMPETIRFIERYAEVIDAPVRTHTTVTSVRPGDEGYEVVTDRGTWRCRAVVIATGACAIPSVPAVAEGVPAGIRQVTPNRYRNPDELEEGGVMVVGASATGAQIAEELHRSGRPVTLAVGEHIRLPRVYRGRDIKWWMDRVGVLDETLDEIDSIERVRTVPSLQLVGSDDRHSLDLNRLSEIGVKLVGRLAGIRDGRAQFAGSLANQAALADLKMNRLLDRIDEWIRDRGLDDEHGPPERFERTRVPESPSLGLDLRKGAIRTIVWATGFRPDHSFLDLPVFDRKGRIRHDGGIVEAPGLYLMGMPFLRRRKSSLIDGAGDDARELSTHLADTLTNRRMAS
jgi:putative flavoprotein involved in K+ transport